MATPSLIPRIVLAVGISLSVGAACGESATVNTAETGAARRPGLPIKISYGSIAQQHGFLTVPDRDDEAPVVVLIHGGFWQNRSGIDLMAPLADDLVTRGYAVWNVEFQRLGDFGGGYPNTITDTGLAIDHLAAMADSYGLNLSELVVIGHSSGGHLALWAAGRQHLEPQDPGSGPLVQAALTIGLAPVVDLAAAHADGIGSLAIFDLLGGSPTQRPEELRVAQPHLADATGDVIVLHGRADRVIPVEHSVESLESSNAELIVLDEVGHFELIDPDHPSWLRVVERLPDAGQG